MRRHKAAAINEPGICSQLICWYVLYYRASLDPTKKNFPRTSSTHATHSPRTPAMPIYCSSILSLA